MEKLHAGMYNAIVDVKVVLDDIRTRPGLDCTKFKVVIPTG